MYENIFYQQCIYRLDKYLTTYLSSQKSNSPRYIITHVHQRKIRKRNEENGSGGVKYPVLDVTFLLYIRLRVSLISYAAPDPPPLYTIHRYSPLESPSSSAIYFLEYIHHKNVYLCIFLPVCSVEYVLLRRATPCHFVPSRLHRICRKWHARACSLVRGSL